MKFSSNSLILILTCLLAHTATAASIQLTVSDAAYNADFYSYSKSKRPTVVLVHNALSNNKSAVIDNLTTALYESGRNVLAINLSLRISDRQENIDMCRQINKHNFDDAVAEIALWMKWLSLKDNVTKISLLGYGLGANQVALYLSLHSNNKINKAVLVSALSQSVLMKQTADIQDIDQLLNQSATLQQDYIFKDISFFNCKETQVTASSLASYYQTNPLFNVTYLANTIHIPMLLVSGERDPHHNEIKQKTSIFHGDNKNLQFTLIPNTPAHFPNLSIMDLLLVINKFIA